MSARKTPILLRLAPVSGKVIALHNYKRKTLDSGVEILDAATDGKQDVTADFDALALEYLLDPDAAGIAIALERVVDGETLTLAERREVQAFRNRLIALIDRHNKQGHGVYGNA